MKLPPIPPAAAQHLFRLLRAAAYVLATSTVVSTWLNGGSVPGRTLIAAVVGALVAADAGMIKPPAASTAAPTTAAQPLAAAVQFHPAVAARVPGAGQPGAGTGPDDARLTAYVRLPTGVVTIHGPGAARIAATLQAQYDPAPSSSGPAPSDSPAT